MSFKFLSKNVIPVNYSIWLKPCLNSFTTIGHQSIQLQVQKSTNSIELNCVEIEISGVKYFDNNGVPIICRNIFYITDEEKVTLTFSKCLPINSGTLVLEFKGQLNNKMRGFYRSKYITPENEEKFAAVTQFEATDARRCFPCWDEPAFKTTFNITLVVPKRLIALSNMGKFALEVASKALPFYEDYFGISYPLTKLDLVAISDFSSGAMENWGLITYRETALLIDKTSSSADARQWVSIVVTHEIAHQWFGNLVTMKWWTHLWLNEGFATFMQYLATDYCNPEFQIWNQFVSEDLGSALHLDALDNSHPVEIEVTHPDEIDEIFDAISYSKGACIIRMLHNWIGNQSFRRGLNLYLTRYAYRNATTDDLWQAFAEASGYPVHDVMRSWTMQMGYPLLTVRRLASTDNSLTIDIVQNKFCESGIDDRNKESLWLIPISISTSESPQKPATTFLMEEQSIEVIIENFPPNGWVKLNPGAFGFYRVRYNSYLQSSLLQAVREQTIDARDRLNVQSDVFATVFSGHVPTTEFLETLKAYTDEDDFTVFSDLRDNLQALSVFMWNGEEADRKRFKKFTLKLFSKIFRKLGWEPTSRESHLDRMLRSLVIHVLVSCDSATVIAESQKRFRNHLNNSRVLDANLRSPVYSAIAAHGTQRELDVLFKLHADTDLQEERNRIESCIGATKDPDLMQKVLRFSLSSEVRDSDRVFVVGSLASAHVEGRDAAWKFTKKNWDKFHELYKGQSLLSSLVKLTTSRFSSENKLREVEEFFKTHPAEAAERTIQQSLEHIRQKIEWWKRDGKDVCDWLRNYGY